MIKKYCFVIILSCAIAGAQAQSLSFADLINLTSLIRTQSHEALLLSKGFSVIAAPIVNGRVVEQYKKGQSQGNTTETVEIRPGTRSPGGNAFGSISFFTLQQQDMLNLLAEAKKSALTMIFNGSDSNTRLYRFDNSLYRVTIALSLDKRWGKVEMEQKQLASD